VLTLSPRVRVFVATEPVDLRKGIHGLFGLVRERFGHSAYEGHRYVFFNRRRELVKVFYWDGNGFAILLKRLAKGRYPFRFTDTGGAREIDLASLLLLLDGVELERVRRVPRWSPPDGAEEAQTSTLAL
jgi:transposase